MKTFAGKLAVITGAGTGMGRELAIQLASEGCHIAICDVSVEEMEKTSAACRNIAPGDIRVSSHVCDVSNETDVLAFRDGVLSDGADKALQCVFSKYRLDDVDVWKVDTSGRVWVVEHEHVTRVDATVELFQYGLDR